VTRGLASVPLEDTRGKSPTHTVRKSRGLPSGPSCLRWPGRLAAAHTTRSKNIYDSWVNSFLEILVRIISFASGFEKMQFGGAAATIGRLVGSTYGTRQRSPMPVRHSSASRSLTSYGFCSFVLRALRVALPMRRTLTHFFQFCIVSREPDVRGEPIKPRQSQHADGCRDPRVRVERKLRKNRL
jgi:hypothetical protein